MGYTTYFNGEVEIVPALNQDEIDYLNKFAQTRRMKRTQGPFFVDGDGFMGQDTGDDVIDGNSPPGGQPGLWCQWVPVDSGESLLWDDGEKFYASAEWMKYLIDTFLKGCPRIPGVRPEFKPHVCDGTIFADGEESDDHWAIVVDANEVSTASGYIEYRESMPV